jgi:long-chain acyl-CoA synthetase
MAVQRDVAQRWQEVTGIPIAQGYGLAEASPVVSTAHEYQELRWLGRRAVSVDGRRDLR